MLKHYVTEFSLQGANQALRNDQWSQQRGVLFIVGLKRSSPDGLFLIRNTYILNNSNLKFIIECPNSLFWFSAENIHLKELLNFYLPDAVKVNIYPGLPSFVEQLLLWSMSKLGEKLSKIMFAARNFLFNTSF